MSKILTYVASRSRVLYTMVPKVACTTLKWGLLEWEGYDPSIVTKSRNPAFLTMDNLIHDSDLFPIPTLDTVSEPLRAEALQSDDWLRFAVTRDPHDRLYSAWESKVLLRQGGVGDSLIDSAPMIYEGVSLDIGASYRSFVEHLERDASSWFVDTHFTPQSNLIDDSEMRDFELIPISEISQLFQRISDRTGVGVQSAQTNGGLGIDFRSLLDETTAKRIAKLYAPDFQLTGFDPLKFSSGDPILLNEQTQRILAIMASRKQRTLQIGSNWVEWKSAFTATRPRRLAYRLARPFIRATRSQSSR